VGEIRRSADRSGITTSWYRRQGCTVPCERCDVAVRCDAMSRSIKRDAVRAHREVRGKDERRYALSHASEERV